MRAPREILALIWWVVAGLRLRVWYECAALVSACRGADLWQLDCLHRTYNDRRRVTFDRIERWLERSA